MPILMSNVVVMAKKLYVKEAWRAMMSMLLEKSVSDSSMGSHVLRELGQYGG